jgi:hypothetical protein
MTDIDNIRRRADAALVNLIEEEVEARLQDRLAELRTTELGIFPEPGNVQASARVSRLDVRLPGLHLRCRCGREVRDYDFEAIDEATLRAICGGCHTELLAIEIL